MIIKLRENVLMMFVHRDKMSGHPSSLSLKVETIFGNLGKQWQIFDYFESKVYLVNKREMGDTVYGTRCI